MKKSVNPARWQGLSREEVEKSRQKHGENTLSMQKRTGFLRRFFSNMGDPVIKILLCALAVNVIFMFREANWVETVGIAVSIFLATFISTLSEHGSEAAFARLNAENDKDVSRVIRGGKLMELPITEIVVGDIILVAAGDKIPADAFVVDGGISVDQSAMTGESREIYKYADGDRSADPLSHSAIFRGCTVLEGEAIAEVSVVGDKTFLGEISREVQLKTRESPLKIRLSKLASQISKLGYMAAILVAFAYLFDTFVLDSGFHKELIMLKITDLRYALSELLSAFMLGLTVIVVAVPEGLPMMIAVVLSGNIKRMVKGNVLVRKPVGIEAAGSMNILFTDKTGTLTEGKLSVAELILGDMTAFSSFSSFASASPPGARLFGLSCRYNTTSTLVEGHASGGNSTDRALLEFVSGTKEDAAYSLKSKIAFDSTHKFSAVSIVGKETLHFVKGAPEKLLPYVKDSIGKDGTHGYFNRVAFEEKLKSLTEKGARVILTAIADREAHEGVFGSLTLLSAVVLSDRIRREAAKSVSSLRGAGIHVVMITGDNKNTAASIAKGCGILGDGVDIAITSDEMARMSDMKLREILPRLGVVARALPHDKSRLVRIAQDAELVVGMTGDGINDAPALKRADIGFAMGSGTQVAKEAGDIIILDNNLSSIARAVLYGRNIFKSIRKFITLQLTMNFCAVGVSMICPFLGIDSPVTVVQMLWINIIMDTLGGLAFAGEAPLPECMKEKPKRRDEPILNSYMISEICILGGFTVATCIAFLKSPSITSHFRSAGDNIYLLTAFFALFIFASVFNCFNARTDRLNLFAGISKNRTFIGIMVLILAIQILFVYVGGSVLRTTPLTLRELGFTMQIALCVFPAEIVRKLLYRLFGKRAGY